MMFDQKDVKIAKMNALTQAREILCLQKGDKVEVSEIVELAEKFVAWILNPDLKYVRVKETK